MSGLFERVIAAIERNADLLEAMLANAGGGAPAATTAKAAPAAKPAPKAATTPAAAPGKPGPKPKKVTAPTSQDLADKAGLFLGEEDEEQPARVEQFVAMLGYYGVKRASELEGDNIAEAMGFLDQMIAGEEIDFGQSEPEPAAGKKKNPLI